MEPRLYKMTVGPVFIIPYCNVDELKLHSFKNLLQKIEITSLRKLISLYCIAAYKSVRTRSLTTLSYIIHPFWMHVEAELKLTWVIQSHWKHFICRIWNIPKLLKDPSWKLLFFISSFSLFPLSSQHSIPLNAKHRT